MIEGQGRRSKVKVKQENCVLAYCQKKRSEVKVTRVKVKGLVRILGGFDTLEYWKGSWASID